MRKWLVNVVKYDGTRYSLTLEAFNVVDACNMAGRHSIENREGDALFYTEIQSVTEVF